MERPLTIKITCLAMAALFLNGATNMLANPSSIMDEKITYTLLALLGVFSNIIFCVLIWIRKKWARTLFLGLVILLGVPTIAISFFTFEEMQGETIALLAGVMGQIFLAMLLYLPVSSNWFNSSRSAANA